MVIRIKDLPPNNSPAPTQFVATDLATTEKLTIQDLVDTGAPVASEAEALAGVNATKRMTPLTVKQAIDAHAASSPSVANRVALKALTDLTAGMLVYLTEGDRFGPFYAVEGSPPHADTAEGVYIVSDTAGWYWQRAFTGPYNACWFGAIGDNSTDNAAAHAAVIAFCIAAGDDAVIYYPSGEYQFDSSVNGYRASSGVALTFLGDGFDATFILSNFYGAGSVMWDFIDPAVTSRVAPTNFVGLNFGSVSRSGGVNPRCLRIHGWGNSEMREVKFGPSNNTQFSAGGMQNIKMDRVESWYGGKSWLWTATDGLTFDVTAGGLLTAASGTPFQATDASSDQYFTYNHTAGRRRYRIATFNSSTSVQLDTAGYRIAADTGKSGWFGHGLVSATAASNQFFYPVGHAGPFTSADVGRVVLIKRADAGTYTSGDFSILRGVIKSVTDNRIFRLGDENGNDLPAFRTITDATLATPCFDFYQPTSGGATLTAGSSHVEITKLHMEHFGGLAMFVDNSDAWLIQGKIHGETAPDDDFGSTSGLWLNDFGGRFEGILDSSVSTGSERVYVSNLNKTVTFDIFSRNTINEVQVRAEASTSVGGWVNIPSIEMANYYSSTLGWLVDENTPDKTAIGYMSFDDGSVPVRRAITSNRGDESNEASISSTVTWSGTAPSGTASLRYRWRQVGDIVFYYMKLDYSVAGVTNAGVIIQKPSDMPVPAVALSHDSGEMIGAFNGFIGVDKTGGTSPALCKTWLEDDGAGGWTFNIALNSGTISAVIAELSGWYFTDAV